MLILLIVLAYGLGYLIKDVGDTLGQAMEVINERMKKK